MILIQCCPIRCLRAPGAFGIYCNCPIKPFKRPAIGGPFGTFRSIKFTITSNIKSFVIYRKYRSTKRIIHIKFIVHSKLYLKFLLNFLEFLKILFLNFWNFGVFKIKGYTLLIPILSMNVEFVYFYLMNLSIDS